VNLSDLQSYILARLSIDSTETQSVTQINYNINNEYLQICQKYKLYEKVGTLTPQQSSFAGGSAPGIIALPSDCLEVENMLFSTVVPELVSLERIAQLQAVTNAGNTWWTSPTLPMYYAYESPTSINVQPLPDLSTPAGTIYYVAQPPTLVNATDTPSYIPSAFHVWIAERAIVAMALNEQDIYGAELGNGMRAGQMEADFNVWNKRRKGKVPARLALAVYNESP
jgi:hypothetical protein